MTTCETCGQRCADKDIVWKQTARQTMSSPAEYEPVGCTSCVGEEYDEAYAKSAARARSNDFAETGGKDWT